MSVTLVDCISNNRISAQRKTQKAKRKYESLLAVKEEEKTQQRTAQTIK